MHSFYNREGGLPIHVWILLSDVLCNIWDYTDNMRTVACLIVVVVLMASLSGGNANHGRIGIHSALGQYLLNEPFHFFIVRFFFKFKFKFEFDVRWPHLSGYNFTKPSKISLSDVRKFAFGNLGADNTSPNHVPWKNVERACRRWLNCRYIGMFSQVVIRYTRWFFQYNSSLLAVVEYRWALARSRGTRCWGSEDSHFVRETLS